jgi:hypothetical protein
VDHVGHPNAFAELNGRAAELPKAFAIVRIVLPVHAVQLFPVEVLRVVDEIITDPVKGSALLDGRKTQGVPHRNGKAGRGDRDRPGLAVSRKQHGHFLAEVDQRPGERFDHIRQSPRLRKREPFRRDKEYFHRESKLPTY